MDYSRYKREKLAGRVAVDKDMTPTETIELKPSIERDYFVDVREKRFSPVPDGAGKPVLAEDAVSIENPGRLRREKEALQEELADLETRRIDIEAQLANIDEFIDDVQAVLNAHAPPTERI